MSRRVVKQDQPRWNPRFIAYAKAHDREPGEQLEYDKQRWPGGCMTGFMNWNEGMIIEWGRGRRLITQEDHRGYDAWLQNKVSGP